MYSGQNLVSGRGGRASVASSSDSLDSILAQFEVVQASAPSPSVQQPAIGQNILSNLLQRSPLARFQGRPPRPDLNVTSQPYQPRKQRGRERRIESELDYQSHTLLPVDAEDDESRPVLPTSRVAAAAVNLSVDSPAVAFSPPQALDGAAESSGVASSAQQRVRRQVSEGSIRRSLSLESFDSMASSRSISPPEGGLRWGQPPRDDLFPLGLAMPSLYRNPSQASLQSERPPVDQPGRSGQIANSAADGQASVGSRLLDSQDPSHVAEQTGSLELQSVDGDSASLSTGPSHSNEGVQPEVALSPVAVTHAASPFASAAQHSAPESLESSSPRSEWTPTSASDYGSQIARSEEESAPQNFGHTGTAAGLRPNQANPRKGPQSFAASAYRGQRSYQDPGKPYLSHLRKRDFESELLERLLSTTNTRGHYASQATAKVSTQDRTLWRSIGLPKMVFITVVFLCLALFLLVFSAGRIHAQRIMRNRAIAVAISMPSLGRNTSMEEARGSQQQAAGTEAEGKPHSTAAGLTAAHQHGHTSFLSGQGDPDDSRRHERRTGTGQEGEPATSRHKVGLKLLQADLRGLAIYCSGQTQTMSSD